MFDIGFWELMVVFLVALVVLGPEQLTKTARIAGRMLGKLRKSLDGIKKELEID